MSVKLLKQQASCTKADKSLKDSDPLWAKAHVESYATTTTLI